MNYEMSIAAVRELSECALLRPAPRSLRITPGRFTPVPVPRAETSFEDRQVIHLAGQQATHGRRPYRAYHYEDCPICGKHEAYCRCP